MTSPTPRPPVPAPADQAVDPGAVDPSAVEADSPATRTPEGAPEDAPPGEATASAPGPSEGAVARLLKLIARGDVELRTAVYVLMVLAILYTLYLAVGVLLPVFLAIFLSILLHPIVEQLSRLRCPRALGAGMVVAALVGGLSWGVLTLSTPAVEWLERGPLLPQQITVKLEALRDSIEQARETTQRLRDLTELGDEAETRIVVEGPGLTEQALGQARDLLFTLAIVVVLIFFLLARGSDTLNQLQEVFVRDRESERWTRLMLDIKREISRYLLTITAINITLGTLTALAMWLIGMPSPLLWGAIAGTLNFMPYIGPATTTTIIFTAALLTFDGWLMILLPPATYLALTILEGNFVTPMIIGKRLTLNPISVFLSFLFWGWAWGVAGVLMAVPILATLKITFSHVPQLRRYRVFFG